jgi:hypothetical protein
VSRPTVTGRQPVLPGWAARSAAVAYTAALAVATLAGTAGNVALFLPLGTALGFLAWRLAARLRNYI